MCFEGWGLAGLCCSECCVALRVAGRHLLPDQCSCNGDMTYYAVYYLHCCSLTIKERERCVSVHV
jgi:hypothetical protein